MRDYKADLEKIRHYKKLLYGFEISGLTRLEALEIVKLAEQLHETNIELQKYYDKFQKSVDEYKKLHRKYTKVNQKLKNQKELIEAYDIKTNQEAL